MDNTFEDFKSSLEDAGVSELVSDVADQDIVGKLGQLVEEKFQLEQEIDALEKELATKQEQLTNYDRIKIPELLDAAGLAEITTKNGYKVSAKTEYRGNISEANSEYVLEWFIRSGGADTVKSKFEVPVSINDKKTAQLLEGIFKKCGVDFSKKIGIAWNTLAGVIKELDVSNTLKDNKYFEDVRKAHPLMPSDLTLEKALGMYKYRTTKVQKPKTKK